jgi:2-iminobutanoate/2-iminopropanoate deaminase
MATVRPVVGKRGGKLCAVRYQVNHAWRAQFVVHGATSWGLRADGSAPKTLDEQLELIWKNIRTILAEANMTTDKIVRLTSYLSDPSYAAANGAARDHALGSRRIPTTAIIVQTLDPEWLVEIEVIAVA